jgi:PAS domain S-box-containing protein
MLQRCTYAAKAAMTTRHILIVEDEPQFARVLSKTLERSDRGYNANVVHSGEEALQKIDEKRPDLVLMDIQLGGELNGIEAAARINARFDVPVIYLTGYSDDAMLQRAKLAEPYGYLVKPVQDRDLYAAVEVALYKHELDKRLKESEERFRALVQASADLVTVTGTDGICRYASPSYERLVGHSPDELVGQNFLEFVHPGDLQRVIDVFTEILLQGPGATVAVEFRFLHKDGSYRWLEATSSNQLDNPAVAGMVSNAREITERKQTEEALQKAHDELERRVEERTIELARAVEELETEIADRRRAEKALQRRNRDLALLNRANQAFSSTLDLDQVLITALEEVRRLMGVVACSIWLCDPETGELVCRQATGPQNEFVRGWRLAPGEGLAGWVAHSGENLIVPDARTDERYFEGVDRQTGLDLRSILTIPLRAKGKVIGVLQAVDTAVARFSPTDLELLEPLTASAAAAIENARLAKEASEVKILQELNHLRSELIANVSHELRTPLGLIKIFCTSLLMDDIEVDPQTRAKFLRGIDEETEKLEAIVDNLLDLSQMENERLHLERQSTDLAQLAEEVIKAITMEIQSAQHHFVHDFFPAPMVATVDAKRIEQVLRNLLHNAAKYSPDGGTITLQGRGDERQLLIGINDQGIGIPSRDLVKIFERFYRVDNEVTQRTRGVGLGLAVCQGIVEAHGGRIWAESALGVGSTFYFSLPVDGESEQV